MDVFCCWPLGFSCRHSLCAKVPRFPIYSNQVRNPTGSRRIVTLGVISETAGWQTACVSSHLPRLAVSHRKLKANNTTTGISCIDISTYSLSVIHCLIGQLYIVSAECRQSPQYCSYLGNIVVIVTTRVITPVSLTPNCHFLFFPPLVVCKRAQFDLSSHTGTCIQPAVARPS